MSILILKLLMLDIEMYLISLDLFIFENVYRFVILLNSNNYDLFVKFISPSIHLNLSTLSHSKLEFIMESLLWFLRQW